LEKLSCLIHQNDTVAVLLQPCQAGETVLVGRDRITALSDIPCGHKVAVTDIKKGERVCKYGHPIGIATADIEKGAHVHSHNLKTALDGILHYEYRDRAPQMPLPRGANASFMGYRRANGAVGIRNELWVVPTVGCVNGCAQEIVRRFKEEYQPAEIDAVTAYTHPYGCSQLGEDHANTQTILADIIRHPNAGGVLVLGLGCENNGIESQKAALGDFDTERVRFLNAQDVENEIECGVAALKELYDLVKRDVRTECPVSALKIGLKCGGSDGFSGITANPLLGAVSDRLVSMGSTVMLTEVAEMFGAETVLMDRAINRDVFEDIVRMINDMKTFYLSYDLPIYENPSPGNKAGGITTLEEKSLGCTQKSGASPIDGVLQYGERLKKHGLFLLNCVANDIVSSTALGASGCQMVLFTTGRGTPLGTFVPTVKVATNSDVYAKKQPWFDFNAGLLLDRGDMDALADAFLDLILQIASGTPAANEQNGYREIAIFKSGITL